MAQYTLNAGCYFRPYRAGKGSAQIRSYPLSTCLTSACITVGQVVCNNTISGQTSSAFKLVRAKAAVGDAGNLLEVAITSLYGVAAGNDTSDGSTTGLSLSRTIPVYVADAHTEFLGWCKSVNGVVESTMIGQQKAIIWDSTLKMYFIDSTNSTAAVAAVTITDVPDYSLGSTQGPVVFKFLSSMVSPVVR